MVLTFPQEKANEIIRGSNGDCAIENFYKWLTKRVKREFQNVIDLYLGRVNDRLLELEELKTRAKNLASAIKGDDKNIQFDLLPVRIASR